jgi:hypothetical protein
MQRRMGTWLGAAAALLVSLVLAHDVAFLARYGSAYGEALAHAGHGPAWTGAVAGSSAIGAGLLVAAAIGWYRLRLRARRLGAGATAAGPGMRVFVITWAWTAARLAAATGLLLTIQENVERVGSGIAGPDPTLLLSADYPFAPAIVVAVTIVAAFVFALVGWRRAVLTERIRAARRPAIRAASVPRPIVDVERRPEAYLGGRLALRGPPSGVATIPA